MYMDRPELTGEGVSQAYQTLELYDEWTLNTTNTVTGRKIGRARLSNFRNLL